MSVIVEVRVPADDFELGRLFDASMGPDGVVELETMVPVGDRAAPYFRIRTDRLESFLAAVRERPLVRRVRVVDDYGEESLLSFEWAADRDALVGGLFDLGVGVLSARGRDGIWRLELRFEDHDDLAAFRDGCADAGISLEVVRLYDPTSPNPGLPFGLTERQREALVLAVECGYYDVPRRCTTGDLAEALGISDQAVSERLRRGISGLVRRTVATDAAEGD